MLPTSLHPLLWLFGCVLFRGTTTSTEPSVHAVAGQSQTTTHSPELKNHTSEPSTSAKSATTAALNLTSLDPVTTTKSSTTSTTTLTSSMPDEKSNGSRNTVASSTQGQEPKRSKIPTTSAIQGTSQRATPTPESSGYLPMPTPTDAKSPLMVAAFGVISFIVILIVVVIILVSAVSLRFKCNRSKDSEDKQKPGSVMVSESCSAGTSEKDNSITLISVKNINMNNSISYPPSEKVL
ncbi:endothelial cell-specific chemotaxis regulator [Apteryx mantelli]|uniref:Endothelial cell-specific chemotaxis regulator n=1 Tax=Apteryx mantelli TaxID=2696672 RepID=A0A8B7IU71_9AVES|nr:PREDICTED: endothelial cell-specific chemotaxis regulator isoform X1 [Apteryx mantelli mantelli]XP_013802351.1 PREDICTED: endothelial cell-specific chemotaxis regulator isoform X2 [Apteryx mantelli mantelli]